MDACDAASVMVQEGNVVAVGGRESLLQAWTVGESDLKRTWQAKNIPRDFLGLEVPVWVNAACFMPQSSGKGGPLIATGTGYSRLRLYDIRAQQRPVMDVGVPDDDGDTPPIMSIACQPGGGQHRVAFADTRGRIACGDLRMEKKPEVRRYKGCCGSVRGLVWHEDSIVSASLDRCLRVHSAASGKLLQRKYLTQRLNKVAIIPTDTRFAKEKKIATKDDEDEDEDDVWKSLKKRGSSSSSSSEVSGSSSSEGSYSSSGESASSSSPSPSSSEDDEEEFSSRGGRRSRKKARRR